MPYGIKTASAIFQKAIGQVLGEDMKNMICYQDDICIGATNENELKRNAGMTINEKKCVNNCSKISFLVIPFQKKVYHQTKP